MKEKLTRILIVLTFLMLNVGIAGAQQNHQYVDLGLPSGTLWATCNVGANNPWEAGDYFAWGETKPKTTYTDDNYKYAKNSMFTKYCYDADEGYNGYADTKTVLDLSDDAAAVNWGGNWRMPTQPQFQELYNNCTCEWSSNYLGKGVAGVIFKSKKNGKTIFFPAAGYKDDDTATGVGSDGTYWSSSLLTDFSYRALCLGFGSDNYINPDSDCGRMLGTSVRPVRR